MSEFSNLLIKILLNCLDLHYKKKKTCKFAVFMNNFNSQTVMEYETSVKLPLEHSNHKEMSLGV